MKILFRILRFPTTEYYLSVKRYNYTFITTASDLHLKLLSKYTNKYYTKEELNAILCNVLARLIKSNADYFSILHLYKTIMMLNVPLNILRGKKYATLFGSMHFVSSTILPILEYMSVDEVENVKTPYFYSDDNVLIRVGECMLNYVRYSKLKYLPSEAIKLLAEKDLPNEISKIALVTILRHNSIFKLSREQQKELMLLMI